MQQFKKEFKDVNITDKTISNVQSCIRLNDYTEIDDGTHCLYFNMIGLFSFRHWTVKETINFFLDFLKILNLSPDYVTIHPDKFKEWSEYYTNVDIRSDNECIWSDGEMGGYCTEFYINDIEIGNIVNCNGDCIDVGFGLERLLGLMCGFKPDKLENISDTITKIIESGYKPSPNKQGYILRKLLTDFIKLGGKMEHPYFYQEMERYNKMLIRYESLKVKFKHKSKEWWYDTHGINLDEMN